MIRAIVSLCTLLLCVPLSVATAESRIGFGTNLGVTHYVPSGGGDGVTVIGWPNGGNLLGVAQPGLRLSMLGSAGLDELYIDTGFSILSGSGDSFSMLAGTLNYQRNLAPPEETGAYLTAGFGLVRADFGGAESTNLVLGGGIGARRGLAHGNGALRVEARVDRMFEDDSGFRALTEVGLKFGFDLWLN